MKTATTVTKGLKLDTAVILTTAGVFGRSMANHDGAIGPLTRVGGLSLFMRTLLTLQRAQVNNVIVLSGDELATVGRNLRDDPRLTLSLRWLPVREFPPEDPRTWQALASDIRGTCLVVGAQAVFARGLVEQFREELQDGQVGLVVRVHPRESPPAVMQGRLANPLVQRHADRLVALHDWPVEESAAEAVGNSLGTNWQIAADMVVLPSTLLATSGMAEEVREREAEAQSQPQQRSLRISRTGGRSNGRSLERESAPLPAGRLLRSVSSMVSPIRALLDQAASDGRVRVLMASAGTPHWYQDVHGPADPKVAERTLLRSLKGELEGFVDRHFNRRFSGALTPLFLRLGLSANAVTGISMAFGLAAAASIAAGNYAAGIIGALLFQFSAIVDCCDGEVARLTFTESSFGERLDILGDNIVHAAIFAGIAWSVYQQWTPGDGQWIPLALGSAALIANGLSLWLVLRAKKLRSQQNWTSPKQASRSNFILKNVASRDFSVVLLAFALMNHLDWFLWLLAIGTNVFWIVMVWLTRPSLSARG